MSGRKKIKKRMSADDRSAQIVGVATALFAKKGFKGTTTREIAKKAGISEALIFRHFSRKEDLYTAIINSKCNDIDGQSRLIKALEGKRGRDVLHEIASFLISEYQRDTTFMRLLLFSALEKHRLSDIFIKTKGMELISYLETHIKELIEEGALKDVDPTIAARAFMGMVLHYIISQEIYGLKRYFKRPDDIVIDTFIEIFFEGLKRRKL